MATTTGEKIYSSLLTQFVREDVPGVYNPASTTRVVMTQVKGEFVPEEQWANFRPDGFNEDAWNALSKTHTMFSGTFQPDFSHIEFLFEMCAGVKNLAVTNPTADTVQYVYEPPAMGSREINTYSLERGTPDNCDVATYGILVSLSMESDRDAASISGAFSMLARKPTLVGVSMSGGVAQNHRTRITAANVSSALVLSIVVPGVAQAKAVSLAIGDTVQQTKDKFTAVGLTVNAVGTIATGSGKSQVINYTGNGPLTIGGVTVDITTPESVATLVTRIKAANPTRTTLAGAGTITKGAVDASKIVVTNSLATAANNTYNLNGTYSNSPRYDSVSGYSIVYYAANSAWAIQPTSSIGNYSDKLVSGGMAAASPTSSGPNEVPAGNWARPGIGGDANITFTQGAGPASVSITLTDNASAGNVADFPVTGTGATSVGTAPGGAGGQIDLEFTSPANSLVTVSKTSGDAGYVLSTPQLGSDGKLRVPKRIPILPQMMSFRQADSRAALDAANAVSKVKLIRWAYDSLVSAEWFADENVLTFQSHTDNADAKRTMGVKLAKSSAQLTQMLADAAASPSTARWNECRFAHPDAKHLVRSIMLSSASGAAPIKAAGNIQAFEFPLGSVLSDTPTSENSAALVIRKAI